MIKALTAFALLAPFALQPAAAATTINVSTAAQLVAALKAAKPGDTIQLADGDYGDQFIATTSGTAEKPITLVGSQKAVLHDPKFEASDTDCPSGLTGYGLWLNGASYWNLKGFTVTKSKKGIVLDGATHVTIDSVSVHDIGYEGVHFRKSSAYGVIKNSSVYNTGLEQPGYGEGVYIGSAVSNRPCYGNTDGADRGDRDNGTFTGPGVFVDGYAERRPRLSRSPPNRRRSAGPRPGRPWCAAVRTRR